ncbi:hypothetical protein ACWDGI_41550 [Streptomyces sp. NPDC001220]
MTVKRLHDAGVTSENAYLAATASNGSSLAPWLTSSKTEDIEPADRWRVFVGERAPTFSALAPALAGYDDRELAATGPHGSKESR